MRIRQETVHDRPVVERLVTEAFKSAPHASGEEGTLVAALRQSGAFLPALSLVAEQDGEIMGHILFTKASVGGQQVLVGPPVREAPVSGAGRRNRPDPGGAPDCQGDGLPICLRPGQRNVLSAGGIPPRRPAGGGSPPGDSRQKFYGHPAAGGCAGAARTPRLRQGVWPVKQPNPAPWKK